MATRPKISRKRRQQILEAAVEVIAERGVCGARIADVAARGGTSAPLVLYYFESKDKLLTEALAYAEDRFYLAIFRGVDEPRRRERAARSPDRAYVWAREHSGYSARGRGALDRALVAGSCATKRPAASEPPSTVAGAGRSPISCAKASRPVSSPTSTPTSFRCFSPLCSMVWCLQQCSGRPGGRVRAGARYLRRRGVSLPGVLREET